MPAKLRPSVAAAIGATALTLEHSALPLRRPSYNEPPFNSKPLVRTVTRRLNGYQPNWFSVISLEGQTSYVGVVRQYAVATDVAMKGSGVQFRVLFNDSIVENFQLPTDAEICRDPSVLPWPVFKIPTFKVVPLGQRFELQVRNMGANNRYYFAGLFGYFYPDVDPTSYTNLDRNRRG